jgi:hypothetical protein
MNVSEFSKQIQAKACQVWTLSHEGIKTVRVAGSFKDCLFWLDNNFDFCETQKTVATVSSDHPEWLPCTVNGEFVKGEAVFKQ